MYYAFVVGMTCQVSDVQVDSKQMRRLTLAHEVGGNGLTACPIAVADDHMNAAFRKAAGRGFTDAAGTPRDNR